jgi:N-acyl-D-aspartate/D-glutamate deacylase
MPETVDLVILNGTIIDGTGKPQFLGDIAVRDGKIVYVSGPSKPRITPAQFASVESIDAAGKIVTPGWIDVHTHLDAQVTWDPSVSPVAENGVTTVVMGNCGVGFAPCRAKDRKYVMELMEGVEDIPLGSMTAGIQWEWETFPEFLNALDKKRFALDIAVLIGHGPVRAYVMGERANAMDRPGGPKASPITADEIERVAAIVGEAVKAGAIGFSTSRTLLHRDVHGVLVPGTLAPEDELMAIGKAMGEAGGGVFEMASDFMSGDDVPAKPENHADRLKHFGREWVWIRKLSKFFNVTVQFCLGIPSHMKANKSFRHMLRQMESANAQGCNVRSQVFVRPQGILLCWDSVSHPFVEALSYKQLRDKVRSEEARKHKVSPSPSAWLPSLRQQLISDKALRARIIEETIAIGTSSGDEGKFGITLPTSTEDNAGNLNGSVTSPGALAKMFIDQARNIFKWTASYEPERSESALNVAIVQGRHPLEVLYDWMSEDDGKCVCTLFFMNYHDDSCADTLEMLLFPGTIPGLGDSGAHLGWLCDPTAHTHLLTYLHRDRVRGPRFPIEQLVKLHTANCAEAFGLADRGTLLEGQIADINVIDLPKLKIMCPRLVFDLPENAMRWIQTCEGYVCTVKSGVVTQRNGKPTGALTGRLVRGPQRHAKKLSLLSQSNTATPFAKIVSAPACLAIGTLISQSFGLSAGIVGGLAGAVLGGITTGFVLGGKSWLSEVRWEGEQMGLELLVRILGPGRLEVLGNAISERSPLKTRAEAVGSA